MPDQSDDLHFPKSGLDVACPTLRQPARAVRPGEYARSTTRGANVRGLDPAARRLRGASRPGLSKYVAAQVAGAEWVVQELNTLVGEGYAAPGGQTVQGSQSGRVVSLVAVSQGNVYSLTPGATDWVAATNNTGESPPLNLTGLMFSASNAQKLWFADGTNWCFFQPSTNSVELWTASAGTLPVDGDNNAPRLICTWRGREVLSGLLGDPQNIFFSKVGDPTNFDYAPLSPSPIDAVALNLAQFGQIGDCITALIPFSDDLMLVGTDHEIWMLRGDPAAGGDVNQVTKSVGIAWGQAWCMDPAGNIYLFSNRTGVFRLAPGGQPQRVSAAIDGLLKDTDTGANGIRLLWDDRFRGVHVYVTPLAAPGATTHYYYEAETGAWWTDTFADSNMDPLCCCVLDGNGPADRVALVGGYDGYVRAVDPAATDDDGTPIASEVWIGPLSSKDIDDVMLDEIQGVLSEATAADAVTWAVFSGRTAEAALASVTPVATGTWSGGRNLTRLVRRAAHAHYIRLTSSVQWAMETIRIKLGTRGMVRQRGR